MGTSSVPEARLKIIAENLARAALQELQRDVKATGTEATGASVGFGRMVFANGQLIASTTSARRGMNMFENALRTLSFQAAGIPGVAGKAAQGIGMLGLGSLWVTGALAGVGAVSLAIRFLTRDAREAATAADALAKSVGKLTVGQQLRDIQGNLTDASERANESRFKATTVGGGFNPILHLIAGIRGRAEEEAGEKAVAAVLAIREARQSAHLEAIKALELEASLLGQSAEEQARLTAEAKGYSIEETNRLVIATRNLERKKEERAVLEAQRDLLQEISGISQSIADFFSGPAGFPTFAAETIAGIKVPTMEDLLAQEGGRIAGLQVAELEKQGGEFGFGLDQAFFDRVQADVDAAIGAFDEGGKSAGMIMAQSFVLALPGLMSGKAAGIFAAFGQIATGASGLKNAPAFLGPLGFGLGALGTVVALFGGGQREAERRHRAELEELRRIRQNTDRRDQPSRSDVHIYLDDAEITDRVMYNIRRAERSDATPRLPRR